MKDRLFTAALIAQLALLFYFELCVLVPLGSWNDQPGANAAFSRANITLGSLVGAAQLLLLIGTIWRFRPLLWFGLVGDSIWLTLHIYSLWLPYMFGASPQYARMYARVFGRTTRWLPNFGNHLAPDAMHIMIDVFVVLVILTLVPYLISLSRASRSDAVDASAAG
ncbi:MAG: hypothetical protein ACM3SW_17340 [Actinomycetota bacterium]